MVLCSVYEWVEAVAPAPVKGKCLCREQYSDALEIWGSRITVKTANLPRSRHRSVDPDPVDPDPGHPAELSLFTLENCGYALSPAYAHGFQTPLQILPLHLVEHGRQNTRAGGGDGMAQ